MTANALLLIGLIAVVLGIVALSGNRLLGIALLLTGIAILGASIGARRRATMRG